MNCGPALQVAILVATSWKAVPMLERPGEAAPYIEDLKLLERAEFFTG
jgi:hypothetical protein